MTDAELRRIENYAIACPLAQIEDSDMLAFVGSLIQDHDHMREKLNTEPDRQKRREKLDAMRAHCKFKPVTEEDYYLAEQARQCGSQPIYQEQAAQENRIWTPSYIHEVQ